MESSLLRGVRPLLRRKAFSPAGQISIVKIGGDLPLPRRPLRVAVFHRRWIHHHFLTQIGPTEVRL